MHQILNLLCCKPQARGVLGDAGVGPVDSAVHGASPHPHPLVVLHYAEAHTRQDHPAHHLHPHCHLCIHHNIENLQVNKFQILIPSL